MSNPPDLTALNASSLFDLSGVVAVITGGNSGIGLMIASTLLANGAKVYIVGLDKDEVEGIAERYSKLAEKQGVKGRMVGIQGDCSNKAEAERISSEFGKREKYITVLFNNAGIMGTPTVPQKEHTGEIYKEEYFKLKDEDFQKVFAVNTIGPYFLSIAFLPLLTASKTEAPYGDKFQPQVINTSSMNGWTKDPSTAGHGYPYLLSKAAIAHLTSLLAHDFLPIGVRVNQIAPGWFVTGMSAPGSLGEYGQSDKQMESDEYGFKTPVGGSGSDKDVGSVALSLVVNRFVNGESILVDGGTLLVHPSKY
ncbi:hypothetical protein JCM6882_004723 [Rhodosporidiobolus microsporus]